MNANLYDIGVKFVVQNKNKNKHLLFCAYCKIISAKSTFVEFNKDEKRKVVALQNMQGLLVFLCNMICKYNGKIFVEIAILKSNTSLLIQLNNKLQYSRLYIYN